MIFHVSFIAAKPALTDSIKVVQPGTDIVIAEQLYRADGTTALSNPFQVQDVGTVNSWLFTVPDGLYVQIYDDDDTTPLYEFAVTADRKSRIPV